MRIDAKHPLLLASASPRRRELLERVGIDVDVRPVDVDETVRPGEDFETYLERVVADKAAAAARLREEHHPAYLVADTAVVRGDRILTKPRDAAEAVAMLAELAGRDHLVATRFVLAGARTEASTVVTRVWFRALSEGHLRAYAASGEGFDKAGGYAIQGIGAMLVRRIDGSYSNVVGLPLCEVVESLESLSLVETCPIA